MQGAIIKKCEDCPAFLSNHNQFRKNDFLHPGLTAAHQSRPAHGGTDFQFPGGPAAFAIPGIMLSGRSQAASSVSGRWAYVLPSSTISAQTMPFMLLHAGAGRKGMYELPDCKVFVHTDRLRREQVINNLNINAKLFFYSYS